MKQNSQSPLLRWVRAVRLLSNLVILVILAVLAGGRAVGDPGDTHHTFSSTDGTDQFPPYSTVLLFADTIAGSAHGGVASTAYRFTATVSGPLEYIQVILYTPSGNATDNSARVVLYSDAGGKLGGQIAAFPLSGLQKGVFKGYFAYNNYGNLDPNDTAYIITKGKSYWLGVEPLNDQSVVNWAECLTTQTTKEYRVEGGMGSYPGGDDHPYMAFTVSVFEPYPPQVQSPGVPLVEGEQVPAEPQGVTLGTVGTVPQTPCLGSIVEGAKKRPVILGADGKVKLRVGDPAPTLAGTMIKTLNEPSGDVVLATLQHQTAAPAISSKNDTVLIGGVQTPPLRLVAQSGDAIAGGGGATIGEFLSVDGGGTTTFFLTQLAGTGVSGKNNLALAAAVDTSPAHVLVRKDDLVGVAKVTILGTLVGFSDSVGEGRWRASDTDIGVRLTLADKSNHLFTIPGNAASQLDWTPWAVTGVPLAAPLASAVITKIGAPGFGPDGVIFPATLQVGPGGVTKLDSLALLQQTAGGLKVIAQKGHDAPDDMGAAVVGTEFKTFGNPVYGPAGKVAFLGTLAVKTNAAGIWWSDGTIPLRRIVRAGDPAPPLGTFSKFTNLVLPNTSGSTPIFEAKLATQAAASVNSKTSDGVWALDDGGAIALLVRNGNYVYLNGNLYGNLSAITALATTAKSSGSAHGVDADGSVRIDATITNATLSPKLKKRAQLSIPIPIP